MQTTSSAFVEPPRAVLTIDTVDIEITPVRVGQLPRLIELAEPMFGDLLAADDSALGRFRAGKPNADDIGALLRLMAKHGHRVMQAIALCSRQPVEWVEGLLVDRAGQLLAVCISVNADFFSQAIPALVALASQAKPAAAEASGASTAASIGPMPSSS